MGRGKHLTIDEWFYHWFADAEKLPLVSKLFIQMFEVCDKIVLKKDNRHAHKFYELTSASSMYPPKQREAVKLLVRLFLQNINKVHWVDDVPDISEDITTLLPRKDIYLVQICLATANKIFITSDTTLFKNLTDTYIHLNIQVYMAEEFISNYPDI